MEKRLIVFSSPSGGGKSTIVKMLLSKFNNILLSISATTRSPRAGEVNGEHYYFLTQAEFKTLIDTDKLIEWEEIFCNYYGTPKSEIERADRLDKCLIFDIDVKGALSIKTKYPEDSLLIFIAPPSKEVLVDRLRNRKTESEEQIARRLQRIDFEMSFKDKFDFVVINDDLETAFSEVQKIINSNFLS